MNRAGVRFVFSPTTWPQTPLEGEWVFLHGEIIEHKMQNGEMVVRGKDSKGEWSAYWNAIPGMEVPQEPGAQIRVYGRIVSQPDGNVKIASQWMKKVEMEEYAFCIRESEKEWEKLVQEFPALSTLKPFVLKQNPAPAKVEAKPSPKKEEEFVAASEFKVEQHFV